MALIDAAGIVVNVIIAGQDYVPPAGFIVVPADDWASIGDGWDGAAFVFQERPAPPAQAPTMTEDERDALILAQSEMIAMLFEMLQGGGQ